MHKPKKFLLQCNGWQSRGGTLNVAAEIDKFASDVARLTPRVPEFLRGAEKARFDEWVTKFANYGAPDNLARQMAALLDVFSLLDVIEISTRHKADTDRVAELYFALSERYDVDRLLAHITSLPRDDRWTAYARSALRSDLYTALAGLTNRVTQGGKLSDQADTLIENWENRFTEGVGRARATLNEIADSEQTDLATLSVALRAIRTLVGQGAA